MQHSYEFIKIISKPPPVCNMPYLFASRPCLPCFLFLCLTHVCHALFACVLPCLSCLTCSCLTYVCKALFPRVSPLSIMSYLLLSRPCVSCLICSRLIHAYCALFARAPPQLCPCCLIPYPLFPHSLALVALFLAPCGLISLLALNTLNNLNT